LKLTTNAEKNSVCLILADRITNADCDSVRQHSGKPHVGGRQLLFLSSIIILSRTLGTSDKNNCWRFCLDDICD
jgi:hypothetical protein